MRAYEKLLAPDGLMLRYKHLDDFGDTTSAFSICSFWWVEALAMMGEVDEAVALFQRLEKYANPLGLFSEDIEPSTGALLGNFPQAYTHVGLIHAAITIGEILDARHGILPRLELTGSSGVSTMKLCERFLVPCRRCRTP